MTSFSFFFFFSVFLQVKTKQVEGLNDEFLVVNAKQFSEVGNPVFLTLIILTDFLTLWHFTRITGPNRP